MRLPLRVLLKAIPWLLCAAAVVFLVRAVKWHDHVHLNDAAGTLVRLIAERDGGFEIEREGRRELIAGDAVRRVAGGLPDINYGIATVVRGADLTGMVFALLLFAPVPLLQSLRLVWMLAIQEVRLSLWQAIKLSFAGNFFNFALPGTTGGDLIKAYYLTRFTHRKTEAVTTVFLDRVVGLLGLVLLAGLSMLSRWDSKAFGNVAGIMGLACGGLAVGALFIFSRRLRHAIRLPELAAKLPAGEHLLRVGRATVAMRKHKALVAASLGLTAVLQFLVMVSAFAMARALNMRGDFTLYLVYVPVVFLIAAVPIAPPQGVGILEFFCVQFFAAGRLNSDSQAFVFALAIRLIQLVWALPGILVPLLGAHLPTQIELASLERADAEPAAATK